MYSSSSDTNTNTGSVTPNAKQIAMSLLVIINVYTLCSDR